MALGTEVDALRNLGPGAALLPARPRTGRPLGSASCTRGRSCSSTPAVATSLGQFRLPAAGRTTPSNAPAWCSTQWSGLCCPPPAGWWDCTAPFGCSSTVPLRRRESWPSAGSHGSHGSTSSPGGRSQTALPEGIQRLLVAQRLGGYIPPRDWFRRTTRFWLSYGFLPRGAPITIPPPAAELYSDASHLGGGAHSWAHPVSGTWDATTTATHINSLELRAVTLALRALAPLLPVGQVRIRSDNATSIA